MIEYSFIKQNKAYDEFKKIIQQELTEPSINRILELIKFIGEGCQDDEIAHSMERELYVAVLKQTNSPLANLALKSLDIIFYRWFA